MEAPKHELPTFSGEVLLCEDDELSRMILKSQLEKHGLTVVMAHNGIECIDIINKRAILNVQAFEMIFIDVLMPEMLWMETMETLNVMGNIAPVIATTSATHDEKNKLDEEKGMVEILSKPFKLTDVTACLLRHLTPISYVKIQNTATSNLYTSWRNRLFANFAYQYPNVTADVLFEKKTAKMNNETDNENFNKILIVDTNKAHIDELSNILKPIYMIITASDEETAVQKINWHKPDIIILNVGQPEMGGFTLLANIRKNEQTWGTPIIYIADEINAENEARGLMLGAVDYIVKPFNPLVIHARVQTHIKIMEYINTIEQLCEVDALTNIANRRYLDNQLVTEWNRAIRDEKNIGLLIIDIDYFKVYNDTFGHLQGDTLLKTFAGLFEQSLYRPADFVARWGGEEFCVILPGADYTETMKVAERIRRNVENTQIPTADGKNTSATVSIGAHSVVPERKKDLADFISRTDKAMYQAKKLGRNRIQTAV